MNPRTVFEDSLSQSQLGFFLAHEYEENIEALLENELNVKQFNLFKEWKESEDKTSIPDSHDAHDNVTMKLDRIETILEKITARLAVMDDKQKQDTNTHNFNNKDHIAERMSGIENILEKMMTRLDTTEEKVNKGNSELLKDSKTLLDRTRKIEVIQENIVMRQEAVEETMKGIKQSMIHQQHSDELKLNVKEEVKTLVVKKGFKIVNVPRVEMLKDYNGQGVSVRKGEIVGLVDNNNLVYFKIGYDGKEGWVPKNVAREIGGLIQVEVPV